ncbi:hypothetical protein Tco_1576721 [Tanacetum coccineum]
MWNDLLLSHEGPSNTRDTKIAALRLKSNAFKALEGEKLSQEMANDSNVKEDTRSNSEFLANLNAEDKGVTRVKAFMAIAEDEPAVGKANARFG